MILDNKQGKGIVFWFFIIVILGAGGYFGVKYYFVLSLLLGNDMVVRLSPNMENVFLSSGETENIVFSTGILANPFCSASCSSRFIDLSSDKLIETKEFNIKSGISEKINYEISADKSGSGQKYYRFEVKCKLIESFFCRTYGISRVKSTIITTNYGLNKEEQIVFENYKVSLSNIIKETNNLYKNLKNLHSNLINLTNLELESASKIIPLENNLLNLNSTLFETKSMLENLKLDESKLSDSSNKLSNYRTEYSTINSSINSDILKYNSLIDTLNTIKNRLNSLKQISVDNSSASEIDNLILEYNSVINSFNQTSSLTIKQEKVSNLLKKMNSFEDPSDDPTLTFKATKTLLLVPEKTKISSISLSDISVTFNEVQRECCLFGKCSTCCKNCSDSNYPVILLHGHAFNRKISAEYSLEDFQAIQEKLELDGYLNAGSILISPQEDQKAIWSDINYPITLKASYYFDIYKNSEESSIIQTKSDSLDSYALRLKEIIDIAKFKTGKNKVIIVSHSMGGLVTRKYMQIFGSENIAKFVMIGTPNHGIWGNPLSLCSILGESLECRDLDEASLFLNKLNYDKIPAIPISNIIGIGCDTNSETGDGIVTNSSAYLGEAKNYYVSGTCDGSLTFLHTDLLNVYKYPKVYEILKETL